LASGNYPDVGPTLLRWQNIVPCFILTLDQCRLPTVDYKVQCYNESKWRSKWKYSWERVGNRVALGWLVATGPTLLAKHRSVFQSDVGSMSNANS